MRDKVEKKRLSILRILKAARHPLSSQVIQEQLARLGQEMSERTVRFHLLAMDKEGLTIYEERHGRRITEKGLQELNKARVIDRVGFLAAKIDQLTYDMKFDLASRKGTVVLNVSIIKKTDLEKNLDHLIAVYDGGYGMGSLLTLIDEGEHLGEQIIPEGYVGLGTVCSITLNGVLLSAGIPVNSIFGGLLEVEQGKAARFVAIIKYSGTSLDPLEIFIRGGMTDSLGAAGDGDGLIGASFREVPAASREKVVKLEEDLKKAGLGGVLEVGWPGHPLCEIPVNEGNIGLIVKGGLNPVAALEEVGVKVYSKALASLTDYSKLFNYQDIKAKLMAI